MLNYFINNAKYRTHKGIKFARRVMEEIPGFIKDLIRIPHFHILASIKMPLNAFGVLFAGPIAGFGGFLLNRNSLIAAAVVAAMVICFPTASLIPALTFGLLANLGVGLAESIITKARNRKRLQKNSGPAYPIKFGPLANAIHLDQTIANQFSLSKHSYSKSSMKKFAAHLAGLDSKRPEPFRSSRTRYH